ncbi:MAG: hypothetical protein MUD10_00685 [Candidatus Pacebacteria bacterium]|jgi:hypothetical protein|nr:hypothetical protein [Candidatus Paceibacterota bacterium]
MKNLEISHKVKRYEQTTEFNCGPFALTSLLSFFGDAKNPEDIGKRLEIKPDIGVYDSMMGKLAMDYGYQTRISPQNLYIFDPTWQKLPNPDLINNLREFEPKTTNNHLKVAINGFADYLEAVERSNSRRFPRKCWRKKSPHVRLSSDCAPPIFMATTSGRSCQIWDTVTDISW